MTVVMLRLSGQSGPEAERAANALLDLRTGPARLERVLVTDDTTLLTEHAAAYQRLVTSNRVYALLCVAVGPRTEADRRLRLPGNLGGNQGYGVLWVGDPAGIDWRAAVAGVANGHVGSSTGLDQLIELLSIDGVFDRVHAAFGDKVPGKVASPGLRLAGEDDEAATFAAALALAIGWLCGQGSGSPDGERPLSALLPSEVGGASLAEDGPIARYRDEVELAASAAARALVKFTGLGGVLRRGDGGIHDYLVQAQAALADLRDLTTRLLRESDAVGDLTDNQRRSLRDAGILFRADSAPSSPAPTAVAAAERSPVYRVLSEAIRGGDTLVLVERRLTRTADAVKRRGSASYLPQVDVACPITLLDHLADQHPRRTLRSTEAAEARQELGVDAAVQSARALADLVVGVANREWSTSLVSSGNLSRVRIAMHGVRVAMAERAESAGDLGGRTGAGRLTRLGRALLPMLHDLVLRVAVHEVAAPSAGGQEAFGAAHDRAATLLTEWTEHVQADGVTAQPPFVSADRYPISLTVEDEVAEIREALQYPPNGEMWQLCAPDDIVALDIAAGPEVIRFASRLNKDGLAGTLANGEIEWTSSGTCAGLLRLVPLKPGIVDHRWSEASAASATGVP